MRKIQLLPKHIIARIAAGEVIERPVFAVKELIENAIDAEATEIVIHIQEHGLKKIQVIDNGIGMSRRDLLEAYKPHTTSKISEDLLGISSLGFRGEALASIAAVSTLSIKSRIHSEPGGNEIIIKEGILESILPYGMPHGTSVTVSHLFSAIPARKKFLKSGRTEFRQIVDLVTRYALSYPSKGFLLTHNNKVLFDLPKNQTMLARIEKTLGNSFAMNLIPLLTDPSHISVSGFISHPQLTTSSQNRQFLFVNNRTVTDKLVLTALKEAYGSLLEPTQYPLFILSLTVPYEMVDVNVHPRKEQVSFINGEMIFQTIKLFVTKTLAENNLSFSLPMSTPFSHKKGSTKMHAAAILRNTVTPWSIKKDPLSQKQNSITQIHSVYILSETPNGIMLLDQHAAHERVLYEQYKDELQKNIKTLTLPKKAPLTFSHEANILLDEYIDHFASIGIGLTKKNNTFFLVSIPEIFKDFDYQKLIFQMVDELIEKGRIPDPTYFLNTMLSYLACRHAIKKGDQVTTHEAKELVAKLSQTPNNTTCPHGRPTHMIIHLQDLNTLFKRNSSQ